MTTDRNRQSINRLLGKAAFAKKTVADFDDPARKFERHRDGRRIIDRGGRY
jgi:hypothetical protein